MDNFIITFYAKPGSEEKVSAFYVNQQAQYDAAKGFRGRQLLISRPGTMAHEVSKFMSAEEMAKHPEPDSSDKGAHFVIVEQWDTADDRMTFSRNRDKTVDRELFPLLHPDHTHEFYTDITPKS